MLYIGFVGPKIGGNGFSAISPDFANLVGSAETRDLAIIQLEHSIRQQLECMHKSGFRAPPPMTIDEIQQQDAYRGLVRGDNAKVRLIRLCAHEPSTAIH